MRHLKAYGELIAARNPHAEIQIRIAINTLFNALGTA
jgi:hypothetical protein